MTLFYTPNDYIMNRDFFYTILIFELLWEYKLLKNLS